MLEAAGESGMRRRVDAGSLDRGRVAMTVLTVERIVPGDTPRVADVQPETRRKNRTVIALAGRRGRGCSMPLTKAGSAPVCSCHVNRKSNNALAHRRRFGTAL